MNDADDWRSRRSFTWVRSQGRALPVRVDLPASGSAIGALVVVPSLGREVVVSYRTMRSLAVRAARAGFAAVTFSLSGDGDSQDLGPDDDAVGSWLEDVRAVREFARSLVGDELPTSCVGLRVGAALVQRLAEADRASAGTPAGAGPDVATGTTGTGPAEGAYIAWEPVSGASFLRHHTQLRTTGVPGEPVCCGVELDGYLLTGAQAASLRRLPAARRAQATTPGPGRLEPGQLHIRFEADRRASVRLALGATYFAHVPLDALDEIVALLPAGSERPLAPWRPQPEASWTVTGEAGDEHPVSERFIEVGPARLPAILTRDPSVTPRYALLLSAMGAEVKWGPGRVWVHAARALARHGVVSLRADRSLIGDDAEPDNVREPDPYTDQSVTDIVDSVSKLHTLVSTGSGPVPVAVAGVCAGTWSALRASAYYPIDTIIAVNPVHWNPDASLYTRAFYDHYHGEEAPDLDFPTAPEVPTLRDVATSPKRAAGLARDLLKREIAIRFPRVRSMLVPQVPVDKVRYLLDDVMAGTDLHLVFGEEEERIFGGKGGQRAMARARRRGVTVTVERLGHLDHSLLSENARRDTLGLLHQLLAR